MIWWCERCQPYLELLTSHILYTFHTGSDSSDAIYIGHNGSARLYIVCCDRVVAFAASLLFVGFILYMNNFNHHS